ncbi:hypothetical protein D3C85_1725430 [compost metagenome]
MTDWANDSPAVARSWLPSVVLLVNAFNERTVISTGKFAELALVKAFFSWV